MEITYQIKITDLIEFNVYSLKQSIVMTKQLQKKRLIGSACLIFFGVMIYFLFKVHDFSLFFSVFGLLLLLFYTAYPYIFYSMIRKKLGRFLRKSRGGLLAGEYYLRITSDGIKERVESGVLNTYAWNQIVKIKENTNHIYIFTSVYEAIIIPKEIWKSVNDQQRFLNELLTYYHKNCGRY